MPELSTGHVFMSYSRRDDVVMRRIVTFLRKQGIKVWVDNEKLIPGTPIWEEEIEKAIKSAPAIVVVLSPDSKNSEWVRREISLADQYRKRVFPILVRGDEEASITLRLTNRQYVDIRKDEDAGLYSLSTSLLLYMDKTSTQYQQERIEIPVRLPKVGPKPPDANEKKYEKKTGSTAPVSNFYITGVIVLAAIVGLFFLLSRLFAASMTPSITDPTPDVFAVRTSAVLTANAEYTLTAAVFTPELPLPTERPTFALSTETPTIVFINTGPTQVGPGTPRGSLCDDYAFGEPVDVTIPDGTAMTPGQEFLKTWKIQNTGICAWGDGYKLVYMFGEKMSGVPVPIDLVGVGQEVEVSVNFKAPDRIGEYISMWQMANAKGVNFGGVLAVKVIVK